MKTFIAYYSFSHNNELLAKEIHSRLGDKSDLFEIRTLRKRTGLSIFLDILFHRVPELSRFEYPVHQYDYYIFIAPVWAGRVASPLKSFLVSQKDFIKNYSFITVCGGAKGQKEKLESELISLLDCKPRKVIELWVSKLLKGNDKRQVTNYRMTANELDFFEKEVDAFVNGEMSYHL